MINYTLTVLLISTQNVESTATPAPGILGV